MSLPIRHFAPIAAGTLAIALAAATALLALAHDGPHSGPKNCETPAADVGGEGPFLAENDAAMKKMMSDMAAKPTGDVDADFVAMMVPHHQGAIDMARRSASLRSQRADQAAGPGNHRHPAAGDRRHAARGRPTIAAFAGAHATFASASTRCPVRTAGNWSRSGVQPTDEPCATPRRQQ